MSEKVDALVIFGATGDLAKLETFPALVGLVKRGVLDVPVIGVARSGWGLRQFRDYAAASLKLNGMDPAEPAAVTMLNLLRYVDGDLGDEATYKLMSDEIGAAQKVLYYLEVPPVLFGRIAQGIGSAGRSAGARVMVEKPFGDYVQSIQITMAEEFSVSDRGRFYDRTGAIRDVLQNHMLQVLATVLAEPPAGTGMEFWRDAKHTLVSGLSVLSPEHVVRGQYEGYHQVDGVDPNSTVETYVAVRLSANTWRWAGVPILIRAGKTMPVTATEISITLKPPPRDLFGIEPVLPQDTLRFRIWPETGVGFTLHGKKPGAGWEPQAEDLAFAQQAGSDIRPYDRLIGAALEGDRWLFARQDTVEAMWRIVDPVLGDAVPVHPYAQGSWGPREADRLLPAGEPWHDPAS